MHIDILWAKPFKISVKNMSGEDGLIWLWYCFSSGQFSIGVDVGLKQQLRISFHEMKVSESRGLAFMK